MPDLTFTVTVGAGLGEARLTFDRATAEALAVALRAMLAAAAELPPGGRANVRYTGSVGRVRIED